MMADNATHVEMLRGYTSMALHGLAPHQGCQRVVKRKVVSNLIPANVEVGAVRISANGWEGWVVEGLQVNILKPQTLIAKDTLSFF